VGQKANRSLRLWNSEPAPGRGPRHPQRLGAVQHALGLPGEDLRLAKCDLGIPHPLGAELGARPGAHLGIEIEAGRANQQRDPLDDLPLVQAGDGLLQALAEVLGQFGQTARRVQRPAGACCEGKDVGR
jgi:hypothetical protein